MMWNKLNEKWNNFEIDDIYERKNGDIQERYRIVKYNSNISEVTIYYTKCKNTHKSPSWSYEIIFETLESYSKIVSISEAYAFLTNEREEKLKRILYGI